MAHVEAFQKHFNLVKGYKPTFKRIKDMYARYCDSNVRFRPIKH
jgi:hypothetical protein